MRDKSIGLSGNLFFSNYQSDYAALKTTWFLSSSFAGAVSLADKAEYLASARRGDALVPEL